jgi:HNH endonuclease
MTFIGNALAYVALGVIIIGILAALYYGGRAIYRSNRWTEEKSLEYAAITPTPSTTVTTTATERNPDRLTPLWAILTTIVTIGVVVLVILFWQVILAVLILVALGYGAWAQSAPPQRRTSVGRNPTQDMKIAVALRDGGVCVRCGDDRDLQYDHIHPWSRGGETSVNNLQLLCGSCNRRKSNR